MSRLLTAASVEAWDWDEQREKAVDLAVAGWSNKQIATELGVHRNTVSNWKNHPEFQKRIAKSNNEHAEIVRQRRARETNMLNDRIAKLSADAIERVEKKPQDAHAVRDMKALLEEYRAMRGEERQDIGDNVQRHEVSGSVQHSHEHSVRGMSFKELMKSAMAKHNIIDVTAVEVIENPLLALANIAQQTVLRDGVLDEIAEEDHAEAVRAQFESKR